MDVELRAARHQALPDQSRLQRAALRQPRCELQAIRGRTSVEITIDDDGPGIPPDKYEDVFRPFFRLDESRNVDTGGVGLGLTIARDVARSHGGDVALAPSPLGGLRVDRANSDLRAKFAKASKGRLRAVVREQASRETCPRPSP